MRLTALATGLTALVASSLAYGEAAPEKTAVAKVAKRTRPTTLFEEIQKLLPRGWTLQTEGLPAGVQGMALGPAGATGRAVVLLSVLDVGAKDEELTDRGARAFLVEEVDASPSVESLRPVAGGVAGAAEFSATAAVRGAEERIVRYLVASGTPSYLLTVVAPKSSFEATYRQVVEIATRLRRSTAKQ